VERRVALGDGGAAVEPDARLEVVRVERRPVVDHPMAGDVHRKAVLRAVAAELAVKAAEVFKANGRDWLRCRKLERRLGVGEPPASAVREPPAEEAAAAAAAKVLHVDCVAAEGQPLRLALQMSGVIVLGRLEGDARRARQHDHLAAGEGRVVGQLRHHW